MCRITALIAFIALLVLGIHAKSYQFSRSLTGLFIFPSFRSATHRDAVCLFDSAVDSKMIPLENLQAHINTLLPNNNTIVRPIDKLMATLNFTYPKFYPEYINEVTSFFACNSVRGLDSSQIVYIAKRLSFSEAIHCNFPSHHQIMTNLIEAALECPNLSVVELSILLHSLFKTQYFIHADLMVVLQEKLVVLIPTADAETFSFILKCLQDTQIGATHLSDNLLSVIAEYLKTVKFHPKAALRVIYAVQAMGLDRSGRFDYLGVSEFLNKIEWDAFKDAPVDMDIVLKALYGLRLLGVRYSTLNKNGKVGISALIQAGLRQVRDTHFMFKVIQRLIGFNFEWTYIDDLTRKYVMLLLQCELSLSDFHWEDVYKTFNRMGNKQEEWNPTFRRKLLQLAEGYGLPVVRTVDPLSADSYERLPELLRYMKFEYSGLV